MIEMGTGIKHHYKFSRAVMMEGTGHVSNREDVQKALEKIARHTKAR